MPPHAGYAAPSLSRTDWRSAACRVNPADTRYLYFVARGDGSHAFAETPQEHQANVQRFR